jgi:hypothetical protein
MLKKILKEETRFILILMILSLGNNSVSEIEGRKHALLFLFLYIVMFPVSVSFQHESAFSRRPSRNLVGLAGPDGCAPKLRWPCARTRSWGSTPARAACSMAWTITGRRADPFTTRVAGIMCLRVVSTRTAVTDQPLHHSFTSFIHKQPEKQLELIRSDS